MNGVLLDTCTCIELFRSNRNILNKLNNISISAENPYLEIIDGVLFSKQDKILVYFPVVFSKQEYFVPKGTKMIGADAFHDSSIRILNIPDSVETIGNLPRARSGQMRIMISDENPYLERIDGVLFDKQNKKLIGTAGKYGKYIVPEGTETIGDNAFELCDELTSVEIPDSVTSIGNGAFSACQSLESINIPDSVTNIGEFAFGGCFSLKSVAIPDSVTSIGNEAFEACIALESINIPDGVTSIGMGAFFSCQSLKSIVIPDSVTSIGTRAFECCSALESVSIPFTVLEVAKESWKYFDDASILKSFICRIPDGVTAIGSGAFSNCRGLTSVTIPDSVIAMGNGVFSGCSDSLVVNVFQGSVAEQYCEENGINHIGDQVSSVNMKSGWLSDNVYWRMNNDSDGTVTVFGDGVLDGYGLKSQNSIIKALVIEEGITGNYYDVLPGYAAGWPGYFDYEGFPNLTSITIPNSMATIDAKLLSDCPDLSLVNISADHPTLEIAEGGLYSKPDQKLIRCLSDAESFAVREGTKIIGTSAFRNCEKLTSIIIPESVTIIGGGAFENCASLKSITIPEGVCNIRDYMFIDCSALSSVTIPESVINIGWGAFQNCYSLKEITIPDSVHIINESIFGYGSLFYGSATLNVNLGSYAEQFCQRMGAPYKSFVHVPLDKAGLSVSTKDGAASISAGKKLQMIAAFDNPDLINRNNKNDEVIWSAVNTETGETVPAAAIDAKGQLTIDKNLNETVQLIVTGESALYGTKATAVITAVPVVKKVIADPAELFFYVGTEEVQTVKASTEPSMVFPAGFLTWTPAKKDIVEITESEDGVVSIKPLKAGKTDITVKEPGRKNAKVKVNVVDPVESVELAVKGNAKAGGKVNITAALAPKTAGNKTVEYSLDVGEDIATINEKGQLSISKDAPSGTKITVTCTALGAPAPVTAFVVIEVP